MIGQILNAVIKESKAFLDQQTDQSFTGGTFILKTDFKAPELSTYSMPLCLFELMDGPETFQWLGGATCAGFVFSFNAYNYQTNNTGESDAGYSANLLNFVDLLRQHFSIGAWLSQEMIDIENNYGFKFTLSGILTADALPNEDGLILGYRIMFDSVAIDNDTNKTIYSTSDLEHVTQIDYPPTN